MKTNTELIAKLARIGETTWRTRSIGGSSLLALPKPVRVFRDCLLREVNPLVERVERTGVVDPIAGAAVDAVEETVVHQEMVGACAAESAVLAGAAGDLI